MSSPTFDYLDGNAAAGELSRIFAPDVTSPQGPGAHCGAIKRFADAHVYMQNQGIVARCAACEHVLLRVVSARHRLFLDLQGTTHLTLEATEIRPSVPARSE